MYLLSLLLGIVSWCLACVAIGKRGSYPLCMLSFICCAAAVWLELKQLDHLLYIEDVAAAMDTVGAVTFAAGVLIVVTVVLNCAAFLRSRKQ